MPKTNVGTLFGQSAFLVSGSAASGRRLGKFAGPLAQGVLGLQLGSGVKFNP